MRSGSALNPGGEAGRAAAQDRHARGDECDLLSSAHGLSLAVSAARRISSAFHGLQHLSPVPARRRVERIWEELHMALREALGREASPTAAILDSQSLKAAEKGEPRAGVKRTQWVMTAARRGRPAKCTPSSTSKACRCG